MEMLRAVLDTNFWLATHVVMITVGYASMFFAGFLAIGPKVLAEVDEKKMEMDIVDEQVDTVGRAFLGLTVGCARCHDHKFDPLLMDDYYGLAGIFLSTHSMESFKKIARWHENPLPSGKGDSAMGVTEGKIADANLLRRGSHLAPGVTLSCRLT